jgi:hypothetical protein
VRGWAKQFALVFFVGLIALAMALAYSSITTGSLLGNNPLLAALRAFGVGFMANGLVLWIALRREEGGKPELNPLLGLLILIGSILLALGVLFPASFLSAPLSLSGLGMSLAALAIGTLAMLIAPAYPRPVTTRWPEGGEEHPNPHIPAVDLHLPNDHPVEPQDLTRIEGIGPKIERALNEAGITTYLEVAKTPPERLKEILEAAHLKAPVDTSSWPRQAELAAQGDWEGLKALQDSLTAGRTAHEGE